MRRSKIQFLLNNNKEELLKVKKEDELVIETAILYTLLNSGKLTKMQYDLCIKELTK